MGTIIPNMGTKYDTPSEDQPVRMVDVLFTKTQRDLYALLFGQPHRSFYTNELIREIGGGTGAVQRELSRLARSGLVTKTRIGSQTHYQANAGSPIFLPLREIILKTVGVSASVRQALEPFSDSISLAFLYGSVAQERDTSNSDIDLLLVSDSLAYAEVMTALEPVSEQLGRRVSPTIYTSSEFHKRMERNNPFLKKTLARPRIVLLGDDHDIGAEKPVGTPGPADGGATGSG